MPGRGVMRGKARTGNRAGSGQNPTDPIEYLLERGRKEFRPMAMITAPAPGGDIDHFRSQGHHHLHRARRRSMLSRALTRKLLGLGLLVVLGISLAPGLYAQ